ncbi:MAG TPA: glycosyl hydrolase family 79 C-terminal domain-containing protein [Solirubrobacteraceae bacterium]|nr:glycosyl hydrolase family 79 C-terminal domain-containing protein [Solirubrobacteraceae bacterium]
MHWLSRRSSSVLAVLILLVVFVVAGLIAACGTSAHERSDSAADAAAPTAAKGALSLTVGSRTTGHPIAAGFLGLSLEYSAVEAYAGQDPNAVDPVFAQLIRNLSPGQSPSLRIGGDTTDWTWWPVPGVAKPGGIKYSLNANFAHVTGALARDVNAKLIMGINLEADSAKIAATEARELESQVGPSSIQALELGNEPELYGSFTWYTTKTGLHVKGRPAGYDFADYQGDFSRISAALPKVPLAGPATGAPKWIPELGAFLPKHPQVKVATLHRYPLQQCYMPAASSKYPSIAHLLAPSASQGLADSVAPYVGVAHARHVSLRIDEMNTVSCGGAPGVSNAFVSALWALDATFQMARVGVDGVNFHTYPGAPYELFNFKRQNGRWQGFVAPEYYGLMMFAQAAPAGSSLLRLSGSLGSVRAWATRAPDGTIHIVLINDYAGQSRTVAVRIAGAGQPAVLERLQAKSLSATTGVTLGGQTFGSATKTGMLAGRSTLTNVSQTGGAYVVRVPQGSAAMLTLTPPPAG